MKVIRPTQNPLTNGYSENHRGYDHAGLNLPDEIRAGRDGTVIEIVNDFNHSWMNKGRLTNIDYGNYILIKHDVGTYELHAHLKQHSMQGVGRRVKAGDIIARIGSTGNSSGPHVHSEYRNENNQNTLAEFIDFKEQPMEDNIKRKSYFFDLIWQARFGTDKDTDKVGKEGVEDFNKQIKSEKERAYQYDLLARKAGYEGDTNKLSYEELFKIVNSALQKENESLKSSLAEERIKCLSEYKRGREDMKHTILEFTEKQ